MLKSFFSKPASFGYNLFFPDQTKLAKKYELALEKIFEFFSPPPYVHPELRGLSGEEYEEAKKELDEKRALDRRYSEEDLIGIKVFLSPSHSIDCEAQFEKNIERLSKIAEKRGMGTIEFAKSLEGAKEFLADYVGWEKIRDRSLAVGDRFLEIGNIEFFFELLEEGLTLPTCIADIRALQLLKAKDESKFMLEDITVDDIRKYMGTPEFDDALIKYDQIDQGYKEIVQEVKTEFSPDIV